MLFNKYFLVNVASTLSPISRHKSSSIDDLHFYYFYPSSTEWESVCKKRGSINNLISPQQRVIELHWEHLIPRCSRQTINWSLELLKVKHNYKTELFLNSLTILPPIQNMSKWHKRDLLIDDTLLFLSFFLILYIDNHSAILSLFHVLHTFNF